MKQKIKTLQTLLGKESFVLTGSLALSYHGLGPDSEIKDLDIILVKPDESAISVLKKLMADFPNPDRFPNSTIPYQFVFEGVRVDVFAADDFEDKDPLLTSEGIRVASVGLIVKAKLKYNRAKDWIQLMQISNKIYNPSDFASKLSSIKTSDNY